MGKSERKNPEEQSVKLLPTRGSLIGGIPKEKTARITEAMSDLQLAMNGLRCQLPSEGDSGRFINALGAFARASSMFLRKTVLGDFNKRDSRLLDDRILGACEMKFERLRRIRPDQRRWITLRHGLLAGDLEFTELNEDTLEPEETFRFQAGHRRWKWSSSGRFPARRTGRDHLPRMRRGWSVPTSYSI